jgi:hypothetical protein
MRSLLPLSAGGVTSDDRDMTQLLDAVRARARHRLLDRRLAAGEWSQDARLLTARAGYLISARSRRRLAAGWDRLAADARRAGASEPRPRALRGSVAEAVELVDAVADALRADRALPARGLALAASTRPIAARAVPRLHNGGDDVLAAAARAVLAALRQPQPGPVRIRPRSAGAPAPCRPVRPAPPCARLP